MSASDRLRPLTILSAQGPLLDGKRPTDLGSDASSDWKFIAQNTSMGACRQRVGSGRMRTVTWDIWCLHSAYKENQRPRTG